ncbi:STAS domain-containing protein [Amycolatopsis sp. NPDC054798]
MERASTPVLSITAKSHGTVSVLAVGGDVDHTARTPLRDAMAAAFARHPRGLIVDLTAVHLFSAAGLSALVWLRQAAAEAQIEVVLVATQHSVLKPLAITRLDELFDIQPTLRQAVGQHRGPPTALGPGNA